MAGETSPASPSISSSGMVMLHTFQQSAAHDPGAGTRASFSIVERGSESTNSTCTGTLNAARLRRACASTSSADSSAPATGTTNATPRSPHTGSGTPTTAAASTSGCRPSAYSTSAGRDVLAARDVDVLDAVDHAEHPVGVAVHEVAGAQPVPRHRRARSPRRRRGTRRTRSARAPTARRSPHPRAAAACPGRRRAR